MDVGRKGLDPRWMSGVKPYRNDRIKADPIRAEVVVGFAIAAGAKEPYPAAELALRQAMEVAPENARGRLGMARLLLIKRVPEAALIEIERAIEIDEGKDGNTPQVRARRSQVTAVAKLD